MDSSLSYKSKSKSTLEWLNCIFELYISKKDHNCHRCNITIFWHKFNKSFKKITHPWIQPGSYECLSLTITPIQNSNFLCSVWNAPKFSNRGLCLRSYSWIDKMCFGSIPCPSNALAFEFYGICWSFRPTRCLLPGLRP